MKKYNYLFKLMVIPWITSLAVGAWVTPFLSGGFMYWAGASTVFILLIGLGEYIYGYYFRKRQHE